MIRRLLRLLLGNPCQCAFCRADRGEHVPCALALAVVGARVQLALAVDGRMLPVLFRPEEARVMGNGWIKAADIAAANAELQAAVAGRN